MSQPNFIERLKLWLFEKIALFIPEKSKRFVLYELQARFIDENPEIDNYSEIMFDDICTTLRD